MKKFHLMLFAGLALFNVYGQNPTDDGARYRQNLKDEISRDHQNCASYYKLYTFDDTPETPAPKGYTPFYVSHYGRHGSRWMIKEENYTELVDMLAKQDSLGNLSEMGKSVLNRCRLIGEDGKGRAGELTPIGAEQHRGIANRLYARYPNLFQGAAEIDARSTLRVRCVLSMASFCEALKEHNPKLNITQGAQLRHTYWLEFFNYETHDIDPEYLRYWKDGMHMKEYRDLLHANLDVDGLTGKLFNGESGWSKNDKLNFLTKLYVLGCNQKGVGSDINFFDFFTDDDLYWLAVADSYQIYGERGPHPYNGGITAEYSKTLLQDIINRAQDAIDGNGRVADLRFGHDINLMALIPMMRIDDWYFTGMDPETTGARWQIGKLTPMAANLQFVFYKNHSGDVLVKVLHNEKEAKLPVPTDCAPYYKWEDFKDYYQKHMDAIPEHTAPVFSDEEGTEVQVRL